MARITIPRSHGKTALLSVTIQERGARREAASFNIFLYSSCRFCSSATEASSR